MQISLIFCSIIAVSLIAYIPMAVAAPDCSAAKIGELLEQASDDRPEVVLNCRVTLPDASRIITKKIIMQGASASGALLDCKGSQIRPASTLGSRYSVTVRSRQDSEGNWQRPENVTIKNCIISGSARVYGLAPVASDEMKESSYSLGHTARMQAAAPRSIVFDRVTILASGTTPLYFSTGVTFSSLINSEIKGSAFTINGQAHYLRHGEFYAQKTASGQGVKYHCQDNNLVYLGLYPVSNASFECQVSNNNSGCSKMVSCPMGKTLVGVKAACNLEYGLVTSTFLGALGDDSMAVERASDHIAEGSCSVTTGLKQTSLGSGNKSLVGSFGRHNNFTAFCRENDQNGGDCHIKGIYQCL
jgi:hypothetical protein